MKMTTSYGSSVCFQYQSTAAQLNSVSMGSLLASEACLDTSQEAIDRFLHECSPIELLEDMKMFENKCGSTAPNSPSDNTTIREPNNEDAAFQELLYKKKPRASVYRCSRKEEIKTLRAKASILDARVQDLQFKREKRRKSKSTISSSMQKLWQRVAFSQLDRRRKAEAENILLRDMVRIQILEAKNLRRILKRRTRIESMETALGLKGVKKLLKDTPTGSQHDFQLLLHETDQLLAPMEDFFTTRGVDVLPYSGYVLDVNLDVIDGVYCELLLKRLLPFGIHETENAVWDCLRKFGMDNMRGLGSSNASVNVYPNVMEEDDDTLRSSFFAVMSGIDDFVGSTNLKVVRRFKSENHTSFVCRMNLEPRFESGRQGINGTTTMQIVLREVDSGNADDDATTLMKIYFSAEGTTMATKDDLGTQMVFGAWDKLIPRFPSDVESVLLDARCNIFRFLAS